MPDTHDVLEGRTPAGAAPPYYDPFDTRIDDDPYPIWKRLRDEAPLYYNEALDFYALSRWDDVEAGLLDWKTYRSGRGTILDVIRANIEIPPGIILWEDPPIHDLHRGLLSGVFSPRRMNALEPMVRDLCRRLLDSVLDKEEFDVITDFGAIVPMRTIGFLLGMPEEWQETVRRNVDQTLHVEDGATHQFDVSSFDELSAAIGEYIDWRAQHPSDDLTTELLNAEVEEDGKPRRLTRGEVLLYTNMVAGAGTETAARLIAFAAQLLAEHPDQRRDLVADRSLVPQTIEEVLRYEAPSPVQGRYVARDVEHYGTTVPRDSIVLLLNGSANRDERRFADPDRFDIHRKGVSHLSFGYGLHFCLGAALARLEGRIALEEILTRWSEWDVDYERAFKAHTTSVRGWQSLPIKPRRRS